MPGHQKGKGQIPCDTQYYQEKQRPGDLAFPAPAPLYIYQRVGFIFLLPLLANRFQFPVKIGYHRIGIQSHLLRVGSDVTLEKEFTVNLTVIPGFDSLYHRGPQMLRPGYLADTQAGRFSCLLQLLTDGLIHRRL